VHLPALVAEALAAAAAATFGLSCEPDVGRLLACLAASVPPRGRILELGTGAGVGLAWLVAGLDGELDGPGHRPDVEVVSVEHDAANTALVARLPWPPTVRLVHGDALDTLANEGTFDLIFADAQGGKWEGLERTIAALRPGGQLVVDDMADSRQADDRQRSKTAVVRRTLVEHPSLVTVELDWASGVILATRRPVDG
jgi:predicted O-methyltransferase YrrM